MSATGDIAALMDSPETSMWLKESLSRALERDPVDAANDAEMLAGLLAKRCEEVLLAGSVSNS